MEYNRLTEVYSCSWGFKTAEIITKALKANVSRIWNDLPFTLKKIENHDELKAIFQPLYDNLSNVASKLDFMSFELNKSIKNGVRKLQEIGAFINDRLLQDQVAVQKEKFDVIDNMCKKVFINTLKQYDLYGREPEPYTPTVMESYIILKERAKLCVVIIEECKSIIDNCLNKYEENQKGHQSELLEKFKIIVADIKKCYDDFAKYIEQLVSIFDKGTQDVVGMMHELCIKIPENLDDKKLYEGNILIEIKYTYGSVYETNKPGEAFKTLYERQKKENKVVKKSNNKNINSSKQDIDMNPEFVKLPPESR